MERGWIEECLDPGEQRQEGADRQPEGVKHRQRAQEGVLGTEVETGGDLCTVGEYVDMRQHHSLWETLGTRRKQHDRRISRAYVIRTALRERSGEPRGNQSGQLLQEGHPAA